MCSFLVTKQNPLVSPVTAAAAVLGAGFPYVSLEPEHPHQPAWPPSVLQGLAAAVAAASLALRANSSSSVSASYKLGRHVVIQLLRI